MTSRPGTVTAEPIDFPPPPREIRRKSGRGCLIGCTVLCILRHMCIGLGALLYVVGQAGLLAFGPAATARVTKQETHTSSKGNKTYNINYTYVAGGETYTDRASLSAKQYAQFTPGTTLTVKSFHLGNHGTSIVVNPIGPALGPLGLALLWAAFWNGVVGIFV